MLNLEFQRKILRIDETTAEKLFSIGQDSQKYITVDLSQQYILLN